MVVSVIIPNHGRDITLTRNALRNLAGVEINEIHIGQERSCQRNLGISMVQGKYLFILDSDQIPSAPLVLECIEIMEKNPKCVGIYIPEIIPGNDWFSKLRNFERKFYTGTCIDVARFVRNPCPLFDETMSGPEDADWDLRIRGLKMTSKEPLYHLDNITLKDYLRKKAYYAKSMDRFNELHPNAKVMKLWYRCFWVFIESGKWKMLLRHPIMAMQLVGLLFLRGIIYLRRK